MHGYIPVKQTVLQPYRIRLKSNFNNFSSYLSRNYLCVIKQPAIIRGIDRAEVVRGIICSGGEIKA